MYAPKMPKDETHIASILEQSIDLFRRTGMPELASKWERILKTYKTKKGKMTFYQTTTLNSLGNQPDPRLRF